MKSPLLKKIKPSTPIEGLRLNRRVVIFFICLMVSAFFWFIQAISQRYDINISYPTQYINIPENKVLANELPQTIEVTINTEGYKYLIYKLFRKEKTLSVNIKNLKRFGNPNQYFLLTNKGIDNLNSQFNEGIKVMKVYPDTIFIHFDKKVSKKVPVKTTMDISYEEYYQPEGALKLQPEKVTISGAKELIEKVNYIETLPIVLTDVKENISLNLTIVETPELKLLERSPKEIKADQKVTKYTEASLELPVTIKNLPKGYNVKTFPDRVTVKYNVALDNYEKIKLADFKAVVDLSEVAKGSSKLKVELTKYPKLISAPKISPEKVEYILRK